MKLVTYTDGAAPRTGLVVNDRVLDIERSSGLPSDMLELIRRGDEALTHLRKLQESASATDGQPLTAVTLLAPIPRPTKNVFCLGLNYQAHIEEGRGRRGDGSEPAARPEWPTYFTKAPTCVIGPNARIPLHAHVTERLDWEVELALIIGRAGVDIPVEQAYEHVFGYTILNDISAREVQRRHGQQWFKGKSLDGSCPMGPWIVTRDELGRADNLHIECRVNGVVKQASTTSLMIFNIPEMINGLSAGLTLEPGDIIATGTPEGVGFARTPPEFLAAGDVVECEIEGIGVLSNPVG